jgi:tripartite-type tricarboxylate transporter receptor subunit TctC
MLPRRSLLAAALATPALARAETYPTRAIRMLVGFPPGGTTDIAARLVSERLAARLGVPVTVENRPGATGNIATEALLHAEPDGYTLQTISAAEGAMNYTLFGPRNPARPEQVTQVGLLMRVPNAIFVHPSLPVHSIADLIAYAKANPGKLSFASAGAGGTIHLAGEMFKALTGIQMEHIIYQASPPAHTDIVNGQVQLMFDGLPPALAQVKAGRLRALAVTTDKRSQLLPDIPTIAESGVPGYKVQGWNGFVGPAGLPRPIVDRLNRETVRVLRTDAVRQRLLALGAEPVGNTPEEFGAHMKAERDLWGRLIAKIGLKLD